MKPQRPPADQVHRRISFADTRILHLARRFAVAQITHGVQFCRAPRLVPSSGGALTGCAGRLLHPDSCTASSTPGEHGSRHAASVRIALPLRHAIHQARAHLRLPRPRDRYARDQLRQPWRAGRSSRRRLLPPPPPPDSMGARLVQTPVPRRAGELTSGPVSAHQAPAARVQLAAFPGVGLAPARCHRR